MSQVGRKYLHIIVEEFVPGLYKELFKLNSKKQTIPQILKIFKMFQQTFHQKDIEMANKLIKIVSLVISKCSGK